MTVTRWQIMLSVRSAYPNACSIVGYAGWVTREYRNRPGGWQAMIRSGSNEVRNILHHGTDADPRER